MIRHAVRFLVHTIGRHAFSTPVIIGVIFFLFSGVAPVMALWLAVALVIFVAAKRAVQKLYPGHDWLNHKPSARENVLKAAMAVIAYAVAWYLYTRTDAFFAGLVHRTLNPG